ncbi:NAD-dependent protein deacylase [Pseudomaricurvus alkylphenolicus]|uniref:Sir2 family NAD+-dependent deacetylase n=1 Tax=Pseudomaricurvus alkylphenolicus TaxID=1306991 RepID=UPI00141EFFDE|nr:Sir2 family NAD+-dependent deacetylase [Pseudomaricurvus alkylphenolicus]NIB44373.1 NAD-dependent protein deacylase [Pseudomaricurvus alkylphenolicus]
MPIDNIVILTGAGISAESGIRTFRAADGLWEDHRVEDVATPEAFERDPVLVQRFYNERRAHLLNGIEPNDAHVALAEFETQHTNNGGRFTLVTQNIDDLHKRAGSSNLLPMHGELLKIRCSATHKLFPCREPIEVDRPCPCCQVPGQLRPHVVWFGEMPLYMDEIERDLSQCDLFVSIGTSGNVYPAAGFFQLASAVGARTVELNLEPSANANQFDEGYYGPATEIVPEFLSQL